MDTEGLDTGLIAILEDTLQDRDPVRVRSFQTLTFLFPSRPSTCLSFQTLNFPFPSRPSTFLLSFQTLYFHFLPDPLLPVSFQCFPDHCAPPPIEKAESTPA